LDTRTLCLGVLSAGEASGYDIKKCLEEGFGAFLDVSHASIYPALAMLLDEGLVSCTEVRQSARPDKKIYALTDVGREALVDGLAKSPGRHRVRSEFLALLIFAEYLPPERLRQVLDTRLAEIDAQLRHIASRERVGESAGRCFAAGFAEAVLGASRDYILEHRRSLEQAAASPELT
jgi:PadR family transcriptional regulator, regulatory protein AphA